MTQEWNVGSHFHGITKLTKKKEFELFLYNNVPETRGLDYRLDFSPPGYHFHKKSNTFFEAIEVDSSSLFLWIDENWDGLLMEGSHQKRNNMDSIQ